MHSVDAAILIIASLTNIGIGSLSLLKNPRSAMFRLFAVLTVALVGLTTANFLSIVLSNPDEIFISVKAILFFVVLQNTFFFLFVERFPHNSSKLSRVFKTRYLTISLLVAVAGIFPGYFSGYELDNGSISLIPSPFIALFMLHTLFSIGGGIRYLLIRHRHSMGATRNQFRFMILASSFLLLIAPIANFLLPTMFNNKTFVPFTPLYTLVFSSLIAYAIIRHHLFDIRAAVARSLAYVLSLIFIGLVYGVLVFGVIGGLIGDQQISETQRALYVGFALISATLFHPTRVFFDKLTNKIFYRDAYDPQALLDQLNQTFVSNIELNVLLRLTSKVVEDNFKSEFCFIAVQENEEEPTRIIGNIEPQFTPRDLKNILESLEHSRSQVIVSEELGNSHTKKLLTRSDIAVACRLPMGYGNYENTKAYLLLGIKKSGNLYDKSDIKLLEIIADELMIAIQNALRFEEIQGFAATLQNEVNQATAKLKRTNKKLKALDETKDEFISMASHQLRTPLTSVKGYMSMVLEGDAGELNKAQKELLNQAFVSSQRMVYLIADLLNVSRLKTGKFVIESFPTNLADVVEGELAQLTEVAKSKKLTLTYNKPNNFPDLLLDETKIRQVIMNFADNAIYYTPSGGKISIELKEDKNNIYFMVKDNGLGVPKDEQKKLFTKFYRARNARKARPDGTGLGLFMAKKVINAQGGEILFESREGHGSVFGFTFSKSKLSPKKQ